MQTCTKCSAQSPDMVLHCVNCGSDLKEFSTTAVALKKYRSSPHVRYIYIMAYDDCCPACRELQGAYPKEEVPILPVEGCSHALGCRCFYQPFLDELI